MWRVVPYLRHLVQLPAAAVVAADGAVAAADAVAAVARSPFADLVALTRVAAEVADCMQTVHFPDATAYGV